MKYYKNFVAFICLQAQVALGGDPTFYHRNDGAVTVVEQSRNLFGDHVVDVRRYPNADQAYQSEYKTEYALAALVLAGVGMILSHIFEPSPPPVAVAATPAAPAPVVTITQGRMLPSAVPEVPAPRPLQPSPREAWKSALQLKKAASDARFSQLETMYRLVSKDGIQAFNAEVRAAEEERDRLAREIQDYNLNREIPVQYR
ncbi:MAG: hypothetical protein JNM65_06345 [Verrucomicrobiaceae bacterium]|nr:hypothetical protein [Verrucomicrobiaceae bacterium]